MPQLEFVISSTYPKCPVCNMQWYQQINDGSTDIICDGCDSVWKRHSINNVSEGKN